MEQMLLLKFTIRCNMTVWFKISKILTLMYFYFVLTVYLFWKRTNMHSYLRSGLFVCCFSFQNIIASIKTSRIVSQLSWYKCIMTVGRRNSSKISGWWFDTSDFRAVGITRLSGDCTLWSFSSLLILSRCLFFGYSKLFPIYEIFRTKFIEKNKKIGRDNQLRVIFPVFAS